MRIFIRNTTGRIIKEFKPGLGEYVFVPGIDKEITDVMDTVDTPIKTKVSYIRYNAKQIAESIINDFNSSGLELIEKEG